MSVPVFSGGFKVAVPCGATLGEAPIWDGRTGTLLWVDIDACRLWRWRPASGEDARPHTFGERVSFVRPTPDEDVLLLGLRSGVARFRPSRGGEPEMLVTPEPDRPGNRLNDAGVLPDGSLLFGTMDDAEKEPTGSFYRWSGDALSTFGGHANVTNGPSVDGVRGFVYVVYSPENRIDRHRLGPDGLPGRREDWVAFRDGDGAPDGLTVDQEGAVWVCHYGAGRITRFSQDGEPLLVVKMPTALVTKVAFGGPDLRTAYVTTASRGRDRETDPMAGHVLSFDSPVAGLPVELCRAAG